MVDVGSFAATYIVRLYFALKKNCFFNQLQKFILFLRKFQLFNDSIIK